MKLLPTNLPAFLWHFMRTRKLAFSVLLASPVIHIMESNIQPYALKWLIDTINAFKGDKAFIMQTVWPPIALYFGVWIIAITVWRIQEWIGVRVLPVFQADIRMQVFRYVQQHSHKYFSDNFAGSLANKISDITRSSLNLIDFFRFRFVTTTSVVIVSIIMTGIVSKWFSLIMGIWIIIQLSIAWYFARKVDVLSIAEAEARTKLSGHIVDILTNSISMRIFARNPHEFNYIGLSQEVEKSAQRATRWQMWKVRMTMDIPVTLMSMALMAGVIRGWQQGWVSVGDIVFILFTGLNTIHLVWVLSTELPNFFNEMGTARQALSLLNRPYAVTDTEHAMPLQVTRGEIKFDDVSFHYRKGHNIFSNKSLTIQGGEKVGLVGFSGSGKTTFANLILRLFDIDGGRILIDGQDIASVTQDSLRAQVAVIPQDTSLFHRTLMENIRYGRLGANDTEVIEASKRAHCHEFVMQLPEGYDALVGERGIKLSGGQRQRIAIARAILKAAPILILDEATSSLDSSTERSIKESLAEVMKGRTTIVIAHRLSTLADMDRILVFKQGHIEEDGTHAELLARDGHYAKLWNMQAGGFLPESEEAR